MNLMTEADFQSLLQTDRGEYYIGRWAYYSEVIKIINSLSIDKVLEVGPGMIPIIKDADIMLNPLDDQYGIPSEFSGSRIVHDGTVSPWPMEDKSYDLVIGLQVFEHFDNKQTRAFREVKRIAKRAILSFPYLWSGASDKPIHRAHNDIDRQLIDDWTLNVEPQKVIEIPRTGSAFSKGPRLIYYWEF